MKQIVRLRDFVAALGAFTIGAVDWDEIEAAFAEFWNSPQQVARRMSA